MRGKRMTQAVQALKYCLTQLQEYDRFAVLNFATTVNRFHPDLQTAAPSAIEAARKWVDGLEASGGTAIDDALAAALALRPNDPKRPFTVVFFTDGRPTIGETVPDKILQNVGKRNTANTRIFTFGVGDDVNAAMLDRISDDSRAISTYVRESEDIEAKVSGLYGKISNPVLANLKLSVGEGIALAEVYPPQLPDLFHGSQLVVFGRYSTPPSPPSQGGARGGVHAAIKLTGSVGMEAQEFVYELNFADKTNDEKGFVEDLWARRKVGYLLDQIRVNGEKKELVDEVVALAKRYGITTPYTSYLLVPDGPIPVARGAMPANPGLPDVRLHIQNGAAPPPGLAAPGGAPGAQIPVTDFLKATGSKSGKKGGGIDGAKARSDINERELARLPADADDKGDKTVASLNKAKANFENLRQFQTDLQARNLTGLQAGRYGVEWSQNSLYLRNQCQLGNNAQRRAGDRNCLEIGGVWIDEGYQSSMPTVTVKAMSEAYFRILERHPNMKNVFRISNHLVWVTPSGSALVVDTTTGEETMEDAAIDRLFVAATKK